MLTREPCGICGAFVRVVEQRLPRTLLDAEGDVTEMRECTSPTCASNTGTATALDVV